MKPSFSRDILFQPLWANPYILSGGNADQNRGDYQILGT